jgi:hypothetical protein
MPVVHANRNRRDRDSEIVFTGVDRSGELRNSPDCGAELAVDPEADGVLHVETA